MGRMKSLAFDYATYLADNDEDPQVIFEEIVNGLITIPQWFVDSWVSENPIMAAETNSREASRRERRQKLKESSPTLTVTNVEPDDKIPTMNRITFENGLVAGYSKTKDAKVGDKFVVATFDGRFPTIMDAETNSWKQQNRDSRGRFTQGFAEKTDRQIQQELDEREEEQQEYQEFIEEQIQYDEVIAPFSQFVDVEVPLEVTPKKLSDFISTAVQDDEFPERMMDPYFFQYLQKIAEGVDFRVLERLHDVMEMQHLVAMQTGEEEMAIVGGRGAFITGILLNIKTGQESWASEENQPVGTPMELGKPLDWTPYDEKVSIFSRKRAENMDNDFDPEVNLMRFELVESEMENIDYNYLYDLLLHGTPGWANMSDAEVREEYSNRFER